MRRVVYDARGHYVSRLTITLLQSPPDTQSWRAFLYGDAEWFGRISHKDLGRVQLSSSLPKIVVDICFYIVYGDNVGNEEIVSIFPCSLKI